MTKLADRRPPVAVGHVFFAATDPAAAGRWFTEAGLRPIADGDGWAVLELRGGTHLVVTERARKPPKGAKAPFDLMVDDIDAARHDYAARGLKPSPIRRGNIHDSFRVAGPDGYEVTINSSHAGRRAV
jgi:catechol 2,3-dioxygenase-like lactoylglutathione lyase family enzyme